MSCHPTTHLALLCRLLNSKDNINFQSGSSIPSRLSPADGITSSHAIHVNTPNSSPLKQSHTVANSWKTPGVRGVNSSTLLLVESWRQQLLQRIPIIALQQVPFQNTGPLSDAMGHSKHCCLLIGTPSHETLFPFENNSILVLIQVNTLSLWLLAIYADFLSPCTDHSFGNPRQSLQEPTSCVTVPSRCRIHLYRRQRDISDASALWRSADPSGSVGSV